MVRCPSTPGVFSAGHLAPSSGPVNLSFVDATADYLWGQLGVAGTGAGGRHWRASTVGDVTGFAVLPLGPITTPETVATFEHTPGTAGTPSLAPFRCPAYTTGIGLHTTDGGGTLWGTCRGGTGQSSWIAIDRSTDGGGSWHRVVDRGGAR